MITYFVTHAYSETVTRYLAARGSGLRECVRVVAYPRSVQRESPVKDWKSLRVYEPSWAARFQRTLDGMRDGLRRRGPRRGVYIFSDLDRLDRDELDRAAELWRTLEN